MKRFNATLFISLMGGKGLYIPIGGWTPAQFILHGAAMIATMHRVAQITQRQQAKIIAGMIDDFFQIQINETCEHVLGLSEITLHTRAAGTVINVNEFGPIWGRAFAASYEKHKDKLKFTITPPVQSTAAQAYSKVSILLGQPEGANTAADIANQARGVASKIVQNLEGVSMDRFERVLRDSVSSGETVYGTTQRLRKELSGIQARRALTIARTEASRMWTQGAIRAFKQSPSVTHCSVIGCTSREEGSWLKPWYQQFLYHGESTCNIRDVPINDLELLNFHPNHTGTIVPSRFRIPA